MELAKRFLQISVFILLFACSGRKTSRPDDDYDYLFRKMVSIPLNEQLALTARYDAQADTIAIEVQNNGGQTIWFEDQSFSVKSFVYSPEARKWEAFDLGFHVGDPQPKQLQPDTSRLDAYYPVSTYFADLDDVAFLRILVTGCLDEPCHPGSTQVGAYADVVFDMVQYEPAPLSTDSEEGRRISNSFLLETDLPEGWFRGHFETLAPQGVAIHSLVFIAEDQPGFENMTQQLMLFPDETQALEVLQKGWLDLGEESSYVDSIPELSFQSRADGFKIACVIGATEDQHICVAVARYDHLISALTAVVYDNEPWLTWGDFARVLEAMDRRALEARGD